jgi:hypothetical protein
VFRELLPGNALFKSVTIYFIERMNPKVFSFRSSSMVGHAVPGSFYRRNIDLVELVDQKCSNRHNIEKAQHAVQNCNPGNIYMAEHTD